MVKSLPSIFVVVVVYLFISACICQYPRRSVLLVEAILTQRNLTSEQHRRVAWVLTQQVGQNVRKDNEGGKERAAAGGVKGDVVALRLRDEVTLY